MSSLVFGWAGTAQRAHPAVEADGLARPGFQDGVREHRGNATDLPLSLDHGEIEWAPARGANP